MIKYLVVIGVIAFIYYVFIKKKPIQKSADAQKKETTKANEMVECSKCHIYCELDDAILSNGKYYCSDECLRG